MMTSELARHITEELKTKPVAGWRVAKMRNRGGTAVVFEATKDGTLAALKIYSKELVEKDKPKHLERLRRQLELRDHVHPHLVKILDAGECPETGYLFVVMELVDAPILEDVVADVPRDQVRRVIAQVAQAAYYLHQRDLVHRDIKPSNIALSLTSMDAKLLDLGVVRPVLGDTATDDSSGKRFLGTRRYAPPEFLARTEEHTADGWLAISFYQLGAVLHDLVMRRRLFDHLEGHDLEEAVRTQRPSVVADDIPQDLIRLTKDCLQKDPNVRLRVITWDRFFRGDINQTAAAQVEEAITRLAVRRSQVRNTPAIPELTKERELEYARKVLFQAIDLSLRSICIDRSSFPPVSMSSNITDNSEPLVHRALLRYETAKHVPVNVTVIVVTTMLDAASLAVEIGLACSIGTKEHDSAGRPPFVFRVFAGTFDQGSVHSSLAQEVPLAVDRALTTAETMNEIPADFEMFLPPRVAETEQ